MINLSPSLLSGDLANIKSVLDTLKENNIHYIHLDVMDGRFVPNITFGLPVIKSMSKYKKDGDFIFDSHLMIIEPEKYVEKFCEVGSDIVTFHIEATKDPDLCIKLIKDKNVKVGISLNPETDVEKVFPYLDKVDLVLVMGVHPGFSGQKYIEGTDTKIKLIYDELKKRNIDNKVTLEVDGGIDNTNIKKVVDAGASLIVSGSYLFTGDMKEKAKSLLIK